MSFHLNEYLSIERKYKGRANQYIKLQVKKKKKTLGEKKKNKPLKKKKKLQVTNFLDASILESKIMHFTLCPYDIK